MTPRMNMSAYFLRVNIDPRVFAYDAQAHLEDRIIYLVEHRLEEDEKRPADSIEVWFHQREGVQIEELTKDAFLPHMDLQAIQRVPTLHDLLVDHAHFYRIDEPGGQTSFYWLDALDKDSSRLTLVTSRAYKEQEKE